MSDVSADLQVPDLTGLNYIAVLEQLHEILQPKTYLEIGVQQGQSFRLSKCPSIAVDPMFQIAEAYIKGMFSKPELHFYQTGSDDFFAGYDPTDILGAPIQMAFLDGMHQCEFLFRDFINTERHCTRNSVVALHDCLPVEVGMTGRLPSESHVLAPHRLGWWAGDVWRTSLLLRRYRPDLRVTVLDAAPTGLVLITNLDPGSTVLSDSYDGFIEDMMSWDLARIGITNLFAEMRMEPASVLGTPEEITRRFGPLH